MSKKQRDHDVELLRELAEGQGRSRAAGINHAADHLEACPLESEPMRRIVPDATDDDD